jgi:hypothetical protein
MAIAASAFTALASAGSASAQTLPQVPPPSLISPMLSVGVPVLFEWTPVNPGNLYNFYLQSHTRTPAAAAPFIVYYELQISDAADVTSHVLVDITTSTTIFSFQNQNIPGSGFTSLQRPGLPLAAGLYYWRVRALVNTAATAFSSIGRFSLDLGTGGGVSTPFHDMAITSLVITAPAYVGTASVIVVTVQNTGTFPEGGSPLTITANGEQIARVDTPSTAAGETARITAIWTPSRRVDPELQRSQPRQEVRFDIAAGRRAASVRNRDPWDAAARFARLLPGRCARARDRARAARTRRAIGPPIAGRTGGDPARDDDQASIVAHLRRQPGRARPVTHVDSAGVPDPETERSGPSLRPVQKVMR